VTLVVAGVGKESIDDPHDREDIDAVIERALEAATKEGRSVRDVVDRVVAERGGRRREIYRRALALAAKGKSEED